MRMAAMVAMLMIVVSVMRVPMMVISVIVMRMWGRRPQGHDRRR